MQINSTYLLREDENENENESINHQFYECNYSNWILKEGLKTNNRGHGHYNGANGFFTSLHPRIDTLISLVWGIRTLVSNKGD